MRFILASESPRRRELLAEVLRSFEVIPSGVSEGHTGSFTPEVAAVHNALAKASAVAAKHPDAMVIGADTVVVLNDSGMGKPKDAQEAIGMLMALSGRTHRVITGVAIVCGERTVTGYDISQVAFKTLTLAEITAYVDEKKPFDKAGAYGIQEVMDLFVADLEGDYRNVVGLPTGLVAKMLENMILSIRH